MQKKYRKRKISIRLDRVAILALCFLLPVFLIATIVTQFNQKKEVKTSQKCYKYSQINIGSGSLETFQGTVNKNQPFCLIFNASSNDKIILNSNNRLVLTTPSNHQSILQGSSHVDLLNAGTYFISINTDKEVEEYQISLKLESKQLPTKHPIRIIESSPNEQITNNNGQQLAYNVVTPPSLQSNTQLQTIVDNAVNLIASKGLPINKLSISLIDLNSSGCCAYGQHLDQELRFPASVAKLFWMVYLYSEYKAKLIPEGIVPYKKLVKMIQDSDNESASFIVDTITQTKSGEALPQEKIDQWVQKRLAINSFFEKAGYYPINISQKLFPTNYAKNDAPIGRDLQIRGGDESHPIRNYTTTYHVARLLLEIYQEKAVSQKYSIRMKQLLKRSLSLSAWKNKDFNAIEGFLGEPLPENANFASKMGWNFNTRNDAAIIGSPDGKHKYILVIFGDDPSFYKDKKIFPEVSRLIYKRMTQ
ncbi:hypothetical protein CAL7716_001180 [Calothrix sp. PCC 7716]|nr:hypothetical protein CAL7716_001180 [Calothrix sp. PCC 7716]